MDLLPNDLLKAGRNVIRSICIVGGGPAGLAALKTIAETEEYKAGLWKPTVFEKRSSVGGVWFPAPPTNNPPQTPLYDSLMTNLPHPIMCYECYLFPPSTPLYPRASVVQKYLEDFVAHFNLGPDIRLNTSVDEVKWDKSKSKWIVRTSTQGAEADVAEFDSVIVGNGHYSEPHYPDTPGVLAWLKAGKAMHSAWYRRPENLGDIILVVGGGPSGQDISAEMRTTAKVVIHSVTGAESEDVAPNFKRRGHVVEFRERGEVLFEGGVVEKGVDYCILATGYNFSYPFFHDMKLEMPPPIPPLPSHLYNSKEHLFPLAKQLFPLQSQFPVSTVAFPGLLKKVAPLPILEAECRAIVKVYRNPDALDLTQEAVDIVSRYEVLKSIYGDSPLELAKAWHRLEGDHQYDHRDELNAFTGRPKVASWVKEMYAKRDIMRAEWRELERIGEAEDWVRGVGEGGLDEWIELMRKVLRRAEERQGKL
ncbi:FAD/NAD(P)-binding domain-containing protein [Neolentinus lepideus HHB14362 ss-1]|uniref:FAD/NAD(P)-binding domain-containing protein n=1 Tax=Neolentinus lepideus HHB14362 ss-1 TaxID=1314782 RepID=A0A165SVC8_9AGAM|nr:FAD/NAD(P)-binding domain-containing protein [Neolentinus lepideus HHB14362 ss-1]